MRIYRFGTKALAAFAAALLLASLAPSAFAADWSCWPFTLKKQQCEPAPSCPAPAPAPLVQPEIKPEEKKVEPEKKAEPEKKDNLIAPPLVEAVPETGPALGAAGFSLASSNVGYIDPAIPFTGIRFRYDAAYDSTHPNRAEYFYAKYRSIGGNGVPDAETRVDYQDFRLDFEYAWNRRFSTFIEVPYRFINPEINPNAHGWSDINFGFKAAMIADDNRFLTFQLRNYAPTGPGGRGLGTNHYSLEPSLLLWQKLNNKWTLEGQFTDWIPINGSDYAGNVLQYGLGISYELYRSCKFKFKPVVELMGWTVLSGQDTDFVQGVITSPAIGGPGGGPIGSVGAVGTFNNPAEGETILNLKVGARADIGDRWSVYAGYGQRLTNQFWYKEIFRFEVRWAY